MGCLGKRTQTLLNVKSHYSAGPFLLLVKNIGSSYQIQCKTTALTSSRMRKCTSACPEHSDSFPNQVK